MRAVLLLLGTVLVASGVLFLLQGAGVVHWPRESFMLDQRAWVWRGLGVAVVGGLLLFVSRRF